jgi:hypothetical protein
VLGMATEWEEYERLVARIERVLADSGAVVKHNDKILDRVTGRKRQVDASIRFTSDGVTRLITVECRKRGKRQSVSWIEELATKRRDLGAKRTIAVSQKPVSAQAKKKAARHSIDLRQLSEISEEDIRGWLNVRTVTHRLFRANLRSFHPMVYAADNSTNPIAVFPSDLPDGMDSGNGEMFVVRETGEKCTGLGLFGKCIPQLMMQMRGCEPTKDRPAEIELTVEFPRGVFEFITRDGIRELALVAFFIQACLEQTQEAPVNAAYEYIGSKKTIASLAESHTEFLGSKVVVAFHKKKKSAGFETTVHVDTKNPDEAT